MTHPMKRLLALLILLFCNLPLLAEEANHADHEELRAILRGVEEAINAEKYSDLAPFFHEHLRVTTVNQQIITTPAGLEPYFKDWIGPEKYVKKLVMKLTADDLTEFYGTDDSRFGVVRGSGTEDYALKDGRHLDMKTRWTATVVKEQGNWKILALHIGANFYDNPIVSQFQKANTTYGLAGVALGLVLGVGVTLVLRRNKS